LRDAFIDERLRSESKKGLFVARTEERIERIVRRVRAIPIGFVRTYGDIDPHAPRLVGHVLATIDEDVPWHRVVRSDGTMTQGRRQKALLLHEGVPMLAGRVDLRKARLLVEP
jgi:methylated-DNA-protein-cysteine methyltransferase related protein